MSNRTQIRIAKKVLSTLTAGAIIQGVRDVQATLDQPGLQSEHLIPTADGTWLTVAQVKVEFPDYKSNKIVVENMIATYIGRTCHFMLADVGINPATLSREQMADIFSVTDAAEKEAVRRMTTN